MKGSAAPAGTILGLERKWWATAAFTPNLLLMGVSSTILDVPGPFIIDELDSDRYRFQWDSGLKLLGTAYGLCLVPWLRERFGLRVSYLIGMLLYSLASLACGYAQTWPQMAAARLPQGFAEGLIVANVLAVMYREYPRRKDLAMAFYGVGIYFGKAIAPTLGAFLIDYPSWRWIFFSQVPVGLATLVFSWWVLAPDRPEDHQKKPFDVLGLILLTAWLAPLIVCLDRGDYLGWSTSNLIVASAALVATAFAAFLICEVVVNGPLVNLSLFRQRTFFLSECVKSLFAVNFYAVFTTLAHYMVVLRDYPRTTTGLVLLPGGLAMGATLLAGALLASLWDRKARVTLGMAGMAASTWMLSACDFYSDKRWIAAVFCLWGAFAGLVVSPVICLPLEGLTQRQVVESATIKNMVRILPGTFASLAVAILLEQRRDAHFDELRQSITDNRPVVEQTLERLTEAVAQRGGGEPATQSMRVVGRYVSDMAQAYAVQTTLRWLAIAAGLGILFSLLIPQQVSAAEARPRLWANGGVDRGRAGADVATPGVQ